MPDPLHAVLYRSIASRPFEPGELLALIDQAQTRNVTRGISGLLMHGSMRALPQVPGSFVQWIEGPQEVVRALYATVAADRRHQSIEVFADGTLASLGMHDRLFRHWAMGMMSLSQLPASLDGFLATCRERGFGRLAS